MTTTSHRQPTPRPASRARGCRVTLGRPARLLAACLATLVLAGVTTAGASARQHGARSAPMLLGLMDDALLGNVPDVAFPVVHNLHAQVIRYDLSWARTAPGKPADATNPDDPAYDWSIAGQRGDARRRARHSRATDDRGHSQVGGRRHGQQGARQHGLAESLRLRGRDALQRPARRPDDRRHPARRDALGGLERAQYDQPPDAPVQLPLLAREAGLARDLRQDPQGDLHGRPLRRHARRREETVAGGATKPNYSGPKTFEPAVAPLRFLQLLGRHHPPLDVYSHHPYRTDIGEGRTDRTAQRHLLRRSPTPDRRARPSVPASAPTPLDHGVRPPDANPPTPSKA